MSKFKGGFKELGGWVVTTHARNTYEERVTDDPLLKRRYTAIDVERRIRSGVNRPVESTALDDGTVVYKTQFTRNGAFYYVLTKQDGDPNVVTSVWTEEIYFNYLEGITSKGRSVYERVMP